MAELPYLKKMNNRTLITLSEKQTDPSYGKKPEERSIEELIKAGVININKPKGPTSHQVSEHVKNILNIKKAGQSGTLDPAVTGVLPIGLNKATRALGTLLKSGKEYICLMHIHEDIDKEKLKKTIKSFKGKIKQLPPIKSAIKRKPRYRSIYYIDIIEIKGKEVLFKVGCQAGTYIRKLCHDIGEKIGSGAHMVQLVRTKVGLFDDEKMKTLQDLKDHWNIYKKDGRHENELKNIILPVEKIVEHIPKVWVDDNAVDSLCNGHFLGIPGIVKLDSDIDKDMQVAIMTLKNELIALGDAKLNAKKIQEKEYGEAVSTDTVFIEPGIYPKYRK
ncbi:MAG: RNA-guided pseudouridylation complex pseudouridine synthase subunit Cbf5 [Nanobdellota archaeon]